VGSGSAEQRSQLRVVGRSGGSGGSGGKSTVRALWGGGGGSVWTIGKGEEVHWPLALPSSGHGHANLSTAQTQYTLRSLVPKVEAAPISPGASCSNLLSKDSVSSVHSGSQHRCGCFVELCWHGIEFSLSYEVALPNDAFDRSRIPHVTHIHPPPGSGD
jgi:hypothetical protein